jgi:2-hydroxychromene-2-carboxylate isomerase
MPSAGIAPATKGPPPQRPVFWFHLDSPLTYLRAEEAYRLLFALEWRPVAKLPGASYNGYEGTQQEAIAKGLPIVVPQPRSPRSLRRAMRVASLACELSRGAAFVLAATRLAYAGAYDLTDTSVLLVAGALASIDRHRCEQAACDGDRDRLLRIATRELSLRGVTELPAIQVGDDFFTGSDQVANAADALIDVIEESSC